MSNFIQKCIDGDALSLEIDDYIDEWHQSTSHIQLHEFLGMSKKEYELFVENENYLNLIITSRRQNEPIIRVVERTITLAARSDDHEKSKQLERWLKSEKLW